MSALRVLLACFCNCSIKFWNCNTPGATSGAAGTAYLSTTPEFIPSFQWVSCYSNFIFMCNVFKIVVCPFVVVRLVIVLSTIYVFLLPLQYLQIRGIYGSSFCLCFVFRFIDPSIRLIINYYIHQNHPSSWLSIRQQMFSQHCTFLKYLDDTPLLSHCNQRTTLNVGPTFCCTLG